MALSPDPSGRFARAVAQTLAEHAMVRAGDRILIGFSGGPDSTALARVLITLAPDFGVSIGLAHLNHGLRGAEGERDQAFCRRFAAAHALDLHLERADIRLLARQEKRSVEDAGRQARYAFFTQTARTEGYTVTATGHHRDDHAEQVLLNLVRGTGPSGLRGILPVREERIIRPLIRRTKSEILAYLDHLGQAFVTDTSNRDTTLLRNRVRHSLIPFMETEFNPDLRAGLDRMSRIIALEDDYMAGQARAVFDAALIRQEQGETVLCLEDLNRCHPALASRVIRQAILSVKQDLKRITHTHVTDILALAGPSETGKHIDLPGQVRVYREKEALCFRREALPLRDLGRREKQDSSGS